MTYPTGTFISPASHRTASGNSTGRPSSEGQPKRTDWVSGPRRKREAAAVIRSRCAAATATSRLRRKGPSLPMRSNAAHTERDACSRAAAPAATRKG